MRKIMKKKLNSRAKTTIRNNADSGRFKQNFKATGAKNFRRTFTAIIANDFFRFIHITSKYARVTHFKKVVNTKCLKGFK